MSGRVRALRGFNDVLPEQTPWWRGLMSRAQTVMDLYGYREIRLPLLEATELFARSVGAATDIVEKEMFSFVDRDKHSLSLRPEGTAGCVRAGIDHGLLHNQQQRLWYAGPMFRHERPQAGRYRQFEQIGVEAFGMPGPQADVEVIALSARLLRNFGLAEAVTLELNTIGSAAARAAYRQALVDFLTPRQPDLDPDSQRRLHSNPLRILDSKVAQTQDLLRDAPPFGAFLDADSEQHFADLRQGLDGLGIAYRLNPQLVRGLDYYSHTVFEWTTDQLGAQGTVCAGGRYDALVPQLGGGETGAVGFALGVDRCILLAQALAADLAIDAAPEVFLCGDSAQLGTMQRLAEQLRDGGIRVCLDAGGGKIKAQLKRAERSGARYVVVPEAGSSTGELRLQSMQGAAPAQSLAPDQLLAALQSELARAA